MNTDKLHQLIESIKGFTTNPACLELADRFEQFIELNQQREAGLADEEYFKNFEISYKQFWSSFDKAAESLGFSPEALKSNLNNEDFFPPEQWKAMQQLKREIAGETAVPEKPGKLKRNKNSVRI